MTQPAPAAAWFPDPHDPARLRWWDGAAWTGHVHPPLAPAAPAPAPAQAQAAPLEFGDPIDEEILDSYWADYDDDRDADEFFDDEDDEDEHSGGGFSIGIDVTIGDDPDRGRATISKVVEHAHAHAPAHGATASDDEERARLRSLGMDERQVETAMSGFAQLRGLMDRAAGSRLGRMAAHRALKHLAWTTARGGRDAAMDIVFDGRRYRARGSKLHD